MTYNNEIISEEFTVRQLEAINSDDNLRIIACAGSGKTKTLVGKIKHLIESENFEVKPQNIIAFTYTEKAANELKSRIINTLDSKEGLAQMYVGTIHGWCLKFLQNYNYQKYQNFSVINDMKLRLFVRKNYFDIGMKEIIKQDTKKSLPLNADKFNPINIFLSIMDTIREQNLTSNLPDNIDTALLKYTKILKNNKYFDFTMILTETLNAMKESSYATNYLKDTIKYLIVDEYQDINQIQENLIQQICKISNCKLIVVGDDDQNIYKWRGSSNNYIINFFKKNAKDIPLLENFRSSEGIVSVAETLINHNKERIANKIMNSSSHQTFEKGKDIIYKELDSIDGEDEFIVDYIEKGILGLPFKDTKRSEERGLTYSDICILVRKWERVKSISTKLNNKGIPYITNGVSSLFETEEAKASLEIFNFLNEIKKLSEKYTPSILKTINEKYQNEIKLIINKNNKQESKASILREYNKLIIDALINKETETLNKLSKKLKESWQNILNIKLNDKSFSSAIHYLIENAPFNFKQIGYDSYSLGIDWEYNLQRIYQNFLFYAQIKEESFYSHNTTNNLKHYSEVIFFNLSKFSQVLNDFEEIYFISKSPEKYLEEFLEFIEKEAKKHYHEGWAKDEHKVINAVRIMTIHQSKGLEFPVVIIPGLNQNYLPGKNQGGLSALHYLPSSLHPAFESLKMDENKEDERRLFYVALTRSKKYLLLTRAPTGNQLYNKKSIFLNELFKSRAIENINENIDLIFDDKIKIEQKVAYDYKHTQLDFSLLSDYFECKYKFKLSSKYGFSSILNRRMGYGKSFHSALMEYHIRKKENENLTEDDLKEIVDRQAYFPYESKLLLKTSKDKIKKKLEEYHKNFKSDEKVEFVEQDIQYKIDDYTLFVGKVDLIKRQKPFNKEEIVIVDFKTADKNKELIERQLNLYAIGYQELTGEYPTHTFIHNLYDETSTDNLPNTVDLKKLEKTKQEVKNCVIGIENENFIREISEKKCKNCQFKLLC